jgi:predicted secreted protein
MTWLEFAITYVFSWWMVLFMVLPHRAEPEAKPEVGHVPSAPANPNLRKKFRWTTVLAFIPALALYFIVGAAQAEDGIYTTKTKCKPLNVHTPSADISTRDGYGTGDKKVAPATIGGANPYVPEKFDIPLRVNAGDYIKPIPGQAADFSAQTFIGVENVEVKSDGTTTLNGKPIEPQEIYPEGCEQEEEKANESAK